MPEYDAKAKVAEVLAQRGRWARLEGDTALADRIAQVFAENDWHAEGGDTPLQTFARYARAAVNGDVNAARDLFGKQFSQDEIVGAIASKTTLGDVRQVKRLLEAVRDADVHDELLERTSLRDYAKPPLELDEVGVARVDERQAFRQRLGDALTRDSFRDEAHREDRLERHAAALPTDSGEAPSLHDDIAAAFSVVEETK